MEGPPDVPAPVRVLCVDDNATIGESLRRLFETIGGFEWAGWLGSVEHLPAVVHERRPQLVLLDVDMPGQDAFAALERLGRERPEIKVLMLSGHIRQDYVFRAIEAGAWGYIYKGDSTEEIAQAIAKVLAGEVALTRSFHFEHEPD